MIENRS